MRRPVARPQRRRVAIARTKPAPVRGWNARDAIASMHEADAVTMDNWWPSAADVSLRKGSSEHVTGIGGGTPANVETLAAYRPEVGSQVLIAFAGTAAYNVTAAGAVGAAVQSGLTNARWQCANFSTSNDNFLLCVNGADQMRVFDGSAWTTINGGSTPSITNVATDDLVNVFVHAERPFYVERDSLSLWYPAAGAFAGALTELPLQGVFTRGGYIVAGGSWSIDGGDGFNDLMVIVTSEGEAAVFQGNDPASFVRIGVYTIGKPIGRRCVSKLGGDLLIITTDGVIPCSRISRAKEDKAAAITDSIQGAMADAVALYGSQFGWEATFYAGGTALIVNVPVAADQQMQFVMNTSVPRKPWARFRALGSNPGWPAWCFEEMNGALYFGASGEVRRAWTGTSDVDLAIEGDLLPAFNYFGDLNRSKHFKAVRPIIGWDSNPAEILIGIDVDFISSTPTSTITLPESSGGEWDTGTWDSAVWGGEIGYQRDWYGADNIGFAGAMHMRVRSANSTPRLVAISYLFEPGEIALG